MLEFILGFTLFGYAWLLWLVLSLYIICLLYSESDSNGYFAFMASIILVVLLYYKSNIDLFYWFTWLNIISYLLIGFGHSLLRTYIYVTKGGNKDKLKEHVFRWWFMWPVSLVYWIAKDLVRDIYDFIYKGFETMYNKIFDLGYKK